jgi:hypothetical protein
MALTQLVGAILATAYASVVVFIIYCIFSKGEPDWPMYWTLGIVLCLPASLLLKPLGYVLCKIRLTGRAKRSRLFDLQNFVFPFFFVGVGGTIWWFCLPQLLYWVGRSAAGLVRGV